MAQTDTRTGFRLPWSSDRPETDDATTATAAEATPADAVAEGATAADAADAPQPVEASVATPEGSGSVETAVPTDEITSEADTPAIADAPLATDPPAPSAGADAWADVASDATETIPEPTDDVSAAAESADVSAPAPARKPTKFLADLTKAMQSTAKAARNETLERFTADAKAAVERVHAAAAEEAAELRRIADEDIAGVRDWSKAEIARIREVTEGRISGRKADLEHELESHAGTIEARIERVNAFVAAFEADLTSFYDRLFAEDDPSRFAAMAEHLPEAPSLELAELDAAARLAVAASTEADTAVAGPDADTAEGSGPEAGRASSADDPVAEGATGEAVAEAVAEAAGATETDASVEAIGAAEPAGAVEASAEADVEVADPVTAASGDAEAAPETNEIEADTAATEAEPVAADDPRLQALAASPSDFATAEAEAAVDAAEAGENATEGEDIPVIADDVLAARIAGLVPDETNSPNPLVTTKVMVSGLVSVASIAGFKRHLSRLNGVTTVGVSSGPDGEFVFAVHHLPTVDLGEGITSLPGFDTRITGQGEGTVTVTARDPESHD